MEEKIKKLKTEIDLLLSGVGQKIRNIKSKSNRASGGIKRQTKGDLVENIYSKIIKFSINETKSKYTLINKIGALPEKIEKIPRLQVSQKYVDLKKLKFTKKESKKGYEDKYDGFIIGENKIKMVLEYKAYAELTMLKRCIVDAAIAQNFDKKIKYCLCLLQSQITSVDKDAGLKHISYSAHSLMNYLNDKLNTNVDILILTNEPRKVNEDIIEKKYKVDYRKLKDAVNYFTDFALLS